jgi:RNA polymerase subunit RPABC4/transcription elongation factor Spt4
MWQQLFDSSIKIQLTQLSFSSINKVAIKIMGIKRCPYCRALISDEDQYCKNCGTQLLFPEDEDVEEEIPGDKIIEDDRHRETAEELDEDIDKKVNEQTEEELEESEENRKIEDEAGKEEEVILVEEETAEATPFLKAPTKKPATGEIISTSRGERLPFPEEEAGGTESKAARTQKTEGEDLIKKLEKEILLEEKATETKPTEEKRPGPVTQMVEELGIEEKSRSKKREIKEKPEGHEESQKEETSELPSWIKEVRKADVDKGSTELIKKGEITPESEESEIPETGTDEEWLEEEATSESTMGLPEKVTRSHLELEKEDFIGEEEMELEEEGGEEETAEGYVYEEGTEAHAVGEREISQRGFMEEKLLAPLGFKNFVKAKIFDLLFIVLFWLVSIWMAARSMNVTIFKLLTVATSGLLIFLLILTSFYFFLFYFFIGETLGDRLFRESEEEEHF